MLNYLVVFIICLLCALAAYMWLQRFAKERARGSTDEGVASGREANSVRKPELSVPDVLEPQAADSVETVVVMEIEDSIDLHHFAPRDILSVVDSYLEAATAQGFEEVRLIHGRGKGVQRARIQKLLSNHTLVTRFKDAPATRGGWGATLVWLIQPQGASEVDRTTEPGAYD